MTATLKINFEDGTSKLIILEKAIELDVGPDANQSIEFRKTKKGSWVMAYTKPILDGKKLDTMTFGKNDIYAAV